MRKVYQVLFAATEYNLETETKNERKKGREKERNQVRKK